MERSRANALIIGMVIKAIFSALAWSMLTTFGGSSNPFSFMYFAITLTVGAFLTGLTVGFLVRKRARGALNGFLSAALVTLFLPGVLGALTPAHPLIVLIGFLPFDVLALIGGVMGPSLKVRTLRLAIMLTLISIVSLTAHAFIFGPTSHKGDLFVEDNETLVIENRDYLQDGNVIVKGNATVLIKNAGLVIDQTEDGHRISIRDASRVIVENGGFGVVAMAMTIRPKVAEPPLIIVHVSDEATVVINSSTLLSSPLIASGSSEVTIANSTYYNPVEAHDYSSVLVLNSSMRSDLSSYGFSSISSINSSGVYRCYNNSRLLIRDAKITLPGFETIGVDCYGNSSVTIKDTTLDDVRTHAFRGQICFGNVTIQGGISTEGLSSFYLCGNVTMKGEISEFDGQITRNYVVIADPDVEIEMTNKDTGRLLWQGRTNDYGYASFNLTFTPENHTHRIMMNNRRSFTLTSATPLALDTAGESLILQQTPSVLCWAILRTSGRRTPASGTTL